MERKKDGKKEEGERRREKGRGRKVEGESG